MKYRDCLQDYDSAACHEAAGGKNSSAVAWLGTEAAAKWDFKLGASELSTGTGTGTGLQTMLAGHDGSQKEIVGYDGWP